MLHVIAMVLGGALGTGIYHLILRPWFLRIPHSKQFRFPNGIPRVAVPKPEQAVAVFPNGTRVEVTGKVVDVSVPLSGAVVNVKDLAGTPLWRVEFMSKDKDGS